jgi:PncC family amidohydrolase
MEKSAEVIAGELLRILGLKLATAESSTGGLIGHKITNVPGSSDYYLGGVVSYANEAKVKLLGVQNKTLEKHGAVSRLTVLEMAKGIRQVLTADIGLAVSGLAGPGGALPGKPIGTVWIGLSAIDLNQAWLYHFKGARFEIKEQAADQALCLLCDYLNHNAENR